MAVEAEANFAWFADCNRLLAPYGSQQTGSGQVYQDASVQQLPAKGVYLVVRRDVNVANLLAMHLDQGINLIVRA